jgi:hypothetical protein
MHGVHPIVELKNVLAQDVHVVDVNTHPWQL